MAHLLGASSSKKRRAGEEGDVSEAAAAAAEEEDRISALPDELRRSILTRLTFKDAIRTGMLSRGWRDLWKTRWPHRVSVEVRLSSPDAPRRELDALAHEPRPHRRLDRFSIVVENCTLNSSELRGFTDYAAECRVEDLYIGVREDTSINGRLNFPACSPLLARLSLSRISVISSMHYKGTRPFQALEVIRLHRVSITQVGFKNMMALCPSLLTLDLRRCYGNCFFYQPDKRRRLVMPPNLRNVTVADCCGRANLNLVPMPSLRSFCYRGDFINKPFSLPEDAAIIDLYICLVGEIPFVYSDLSRSLPIDLSGLTVLTICSNVLEIASSLLNEAWPNLSNLQSLKELQLILSRTDTKTLDNIYVFLRASHCHNLERLFVQLPDISYRRLEDLVQGEQDEPLEDGLGNLRMVKVMNFNWHKFEVQLVSSLRRKAISPDKLLLVSPDVTLQDMPGVQEADLSLLKEALTNGQMILSESDDPATDQPFHSEVKKRSLVMPPKLRTITVADCWGFANLNLVPVPSLRSFCYRGDFVDAPFFLPSDAALSDLYIRFADSVAELYNTRKLRKSLPKDLSGLNVLTICWNALEAAPCLMPNTNLHNLRELQLIMSEMKAANLDDLYVFFTTFQCPNLERLFVQLPASSDKPMEGGSFDEVWEEPPEDDLDNPMEGGSFDEVWEEPPEDDLDNLLMVKVMNFNWRCSEVQLVSFLLRKASSLRKLLIVSPNVTPPPDLPCVESDFLLIKEALTNGKIILSESDDAGIQPYHSKVFIMV